MRTYLMLILLLGIMTTLQANPIAVIGHDLKVKLDPDSGMLIAEDRITLPSPARVIDFRLHGDLKLDGLAHDITINQKRVKGWIPISRYQLSFTNPVTQITLQYRGVIRHRLDNISSDYSGGRKSTPGTISPQGIFLAGSSLWHPQVLLDKQPTLVRFTMQVELPKGWTAISQGQSSADNQWMESQPQDEIYLIAAPFTVYKREENGINEQIYLQTPDRQLADRYLEATTRYIQLYSQLIGRYPYKKFALVESFWESGYGMPSFTLLGPQVIRLPFIPFTSYPHEILHNWWGNSVYIDYRQGNWAEGLTAYLADHLLKELRGSSANYRRAALQKYADYVNGKEDFPLSQFRGNHGQVSEAVGYNKMLFLMHMLRQRIGDKALVAGLRRFYQNYRFRYASMDDLKRVFQQNTKQPLEEFFTAWTNRTGAPQLALNNWKVTKTTEHYRLELELRQTQAAPPFPMDVPIFLQLEDETEPQPHHLRMEQRAARLTIDTATRPLHLWIDPRYELFRRLYTEELPPALGQLFGADRLQIILPSGADSDLRKAYTELARQWQAKNPEITIRWDDRGERSLASVATWIFGRQNLYLNQLGRVLKDQQVRLDSEQVQLTEGSFPLREHSIGLATFDQKAERTLGFLSAPSATAIARLGRKLPHYGRYGLTLFQGEEVNNRIKQEWSVTASPLSVSLVDTPYPNTAIPPIRPLTTVLE